MPRQVDASTVRRKTTQPTDGRKPAENDADVLARVYALILSWPTTDEKKVKERSNGA